MKPLEVGLMFWATGNARKDIAFVRSFGLCAGQLGVPGELSLTGFEDDWRSALRDDPNFGIATAVCSYVGEDYSDMATVHASVGLLPPKSRSERVVRTAEVAGIAASLGIPSVAAHIGFVPEDRSRLEYRDLCVAVRDICDSLAAHNQSFALETGQETAPALLAFMEDVGCPNLKVNFDPANMILYGTGDPISALQLLISHVVSVHCKDATGPTKAGSLGTERAPGSGEVNFRDFLRTLRDDGYEGILSIEREESDTERRMNDIRHAVQFLRDLGAAN